jgi:hypothetical protein
MRESGSVRAGGKVLRQDSELRFNFSAYPLGSSPQKRLRSNTEAAEKPKEKEIQPYSGITI